MATKPDTERLRTAFLNDEPLDPPRIAYLNVLRRCNAGCRYCTDWTTPRNPRLDPSRERLRDVFAELHALGVNEVVLSGGEPFLRKDLLDVVADACDLGHSVRLISNGTVMTQRHIHALVELGVMKIGISIDSLSMERMRAIRGLPLDRVLRTIEQLAAARAKAPDLRVSLYVTITKLNIDDLVDLAKYASRLGIDAQYQPVHFAGTGIAESVLSELWPDSSEIARIAQAVATLIEMSNAGTASIGTRPSFLALIPQFFSERTFRPDACTVAFTDIVIDGSLELHPCFSMDPVGRLTETSLSDLWRSDKMRAIRKDIREKRCPGCLYSCHLNKPHLGLPDYRPDMVAGVAQ